MQTTYAPAGLTTNDAREITDQLQRRLISLVDTSLVLKHAHWNVVGPGFLAVHELFDRQVAGMREMADELAERIAALGGIPNGLSGFVVENRTWGEYELGRAVVEAHLGALDKVYDGVIEDHRKALAGVDRIDAVTTDLLTTQTGRLEQMQWFLRAHIENTSGRLPTEGEPTPLDAAAAAATADPLA